MSGKTRTGLVILGVVAFLFTFTVVFVSQEGRKALTCAHDHTEAELLEWRQRALDRGLWVEGMTSFELDRQEGCLRIELDDPQIRAQVQDRLRHLEIPLDAVIFEARGGGGL